MDEQDQRTTDSGIELRPVYGADDLVGFDPAKQLGEPGEHPFTRGVYPSMYRQRLWTMRQYAGMGTADETNRRFRYLLEHGQTGLSVAFDLPTQMGLDSDHPRAEGEVGKTGVAIDSIDDMRRLFDDDPARPRHDVDDDQRDGRDPAVALRAGRRGAGRGRVDARRHRPERPAEGVRGARARTSTRRSPRCGSSPTCSRTAASGSRGGTRSRSAATTCARRERRRRRRSRSRSRTGSRTCRRRWTPGLKVDDFAPRLSFFFACHMHFFEEIAKFRAARRMWARIMTERFGAKDPRSAMLRFHTQTGGATLTAQQPQNNIVRTALEALAAVLGGTQSLHTNSFDEALALPTERAVEDRAAHAAGDRLRDRGRERRRSARRFVLRRVADRRARGAGAGLPRPDRCDGRRGGGDRGRVLPGRDPRGGVPDPAGHRVGRAGDRGCQPVRRRGGAAGRAPGHLGRGRAHAGRAAARVARGA